MTTDQLRTGATLVRVLIEGDESARLPLSDFVEEFGVPPVGRSHAVSFSLWACNLLRSSRTLRYDWWYWWYWGPRKEMITVRAKCIQEPRFHTVILACFPAWAWEAAT